MWAQISPRMVMFQLDNLEIWNLSTFHKHGYIILKSFAEFYTRGVDSPGMNLGKHL